MGARARLGCAPRADVRNVGSRTPVRGSVLTTRADFTPGGRRRSNSTQHPDRTVIGHNVFHSFPERSSSPLYDTVARRRHGVGTPRQGIVLPHWAQTNAGVRFSGLGASNVSSANLARHVLHQNLPCAAPRRSSPTAPRTDCSVVYGIALARALRPVSERRRRYRLRQIFRQNR